MEVGGKEIRVSGRLVRMASIAAEGFVFLDKPDETIDALRSEKVDVFTFMETLDYRTPRYGYRFEWDNLAVLPITTFEHWWTKQIDGKTRNVVRRAEKKEVTIREVAFDESLARGIWEIYNECPIRQGRVFEHYGKDFDAVYRMSATFLQESVFIGAFWQEKLIGFVKLTVDAARSQAAVMHIISMMQHRDKSVTNALIAEGIRWCERQRIPHLVYSRFSYGKKRKDSLSDFKTNNGFKQIDLPRYYVPLTAWGRIALQVGLHHSLVEHCPEPIVAKLREIRAQWHSRRLRTAADAS